jgi:ATP-dependent DNA ligase
MRRAEKQSGGLRPSTQTGEIEMDLMLCEEKKIDEIQGLTKDWRLEVKQDGSRCIYNQGKFIARARSGKPAQILNKKFPHIEIETEGIFDGEIVVFNDKGISDFELVQKKEYWPKAVYVIFDCLKFEGELVAKKPLAERLKYLDKIKGKNIQVVTQTTWDEVKKKGMEGMIVKNPSAPYEFNRSSNWIKVKNWKYTELEFDHYHLSENPKWKGIILISKNKDRVSCAGSQSEPIKEQLDAGKTVKLEIKYLMTLQSGKLRMPVIAGK